MQQPTLQVHGSPGNDNVFMVDNVQIQHMGFGGNQTGFYFNDGLMEEISYQTSSLPAEAPVGGVQINMIPRDGGNQYRGSVFATGANEQHAEQQLGRRSRRRRVHRAQPREEHLRRQCHLRRSDPARPALVLRHVPQVVGEQLPREHVRLARQPGRGRPAHPGRHVAPDLAGRAPAQDRGASTIAAPSAAAIARTTGSRPASTSRSPRSCRRPGSTTSASSSGARRSRTGC